MNYGNRAVLTFALACAATGALAQSSTNYTGPTRGFLLERGLIAEPKSFSVDLATGIGDQNIGGVRIGVPNSEIIINSALNGDTDANEIALKWGLAPIPADTVRINTAVYGGLSHIDFEDDQGNDVDYTNVVLGAAFTVLEQGLILNVNPELEFADDERDDTIFNLGFGVHYNLFDTEYGRFQPGAEVTFVSGGEDDDTVIDLGMRWLVKEDITLDFVVFHGDSEDVTSLPGIVRLNAAF